MRQIKLTKTVFVLSTIITFFLNKDSGYEKRRSMKFLECVSFQAKSVLK